MSKQRGRGRGCFTLDNGGLWRGMEKGQAAEGVNKGVERRRTCGGTWVACGLDRQALEMMMSRGELV